jgi:Uma2 family endonuclease
LGLNNSTVGFHCGLIIRKVAIFTLTDEEFMTFSKHEGNYELVNGEVISMGNSGMEHGNIGAYLGGLIELYARSKKLGVTCDSSTAFTFKSGNKCSPDISFVSKQRLQGIKRLPKGFFQGSPDLAKEHLTLRTPYFANLLLSVS